MATYFMKSKCKQDATKSENARLRAECVKIQRMYKDAPMQVDDVNEVQEIVLRVVDEVRNELIVRHL